MIRAVAAILMVGLLVDPATAACQFDSQGTITNPSDPSCRDAMFTYTENDSTGSGIAIGYPVPVPVDSLTPVTGFRTWESLHARHQALDAEFDFVTGSVVGQTVSGRDIWAYVIGDPDQTTRDGRPEPAVMLNGGIHAREWQSPEAVTAVFERLVEMAGDDGVGSWLIDDVTVVILPVHNVDGLISTQRYPDRVSASVEQPREGRMRRKNLANPTAPGSAIDQDLDTTSDNFYGVDLNRNNARGFGLNGGSLSNPVSLVNRGSAATSEPEARALLAAAALGPENRLRFYVDAHSFTQIFLAPMTGNARRDAITTNLATRMRAALNDKYFWGPDRPGSGGIGTTADYFAYTFQIPSWTLELEPRNGGAAYGGTGVSHSGFILPAGEVPRMQAEVFTMTLPGYYLMGGAASVAAAEIRELDSGEPVYRGDLVPGPDGASLRVGTNRALVPAAATGFGSPSTNPCAGGAMPAKWSAIRDSPGRWRPPSRSKSPGWEHWISTRAPMPGSPGRVARPTAFADMPPTPSAWNSRFREPGPQRVPQPPCCRSPRSI